MKLSDLPVEDLKVIAQFNKIVLNYLRMVKMQKEHDTETTLNKSKQ